MFYYKKLGENMFRILEIKKIVHNLGRHYIEDTIQDHLKSSKISLQDIKQDKSRPCKTTILYYPQKAVWQYLQSLEKKGEIQLRKRGIKSFDDIIEREYHTRELRSSSPTRRNL